MTTVENLTYKGNAIDSLSFKGQEVDILNVKGYHWEKSSPQPTTFSIKPILYDSETGTGYANIYGVPKGNPIAVTGNSTFLGVASEGHDLSQVVYSGNTNSVWAFPIDNWGFIFNRFYQYDKWPGGTGGTQFSITENFTIDGSTYSLPFKSELDENNTFLLEGCFLNKVIKVPSTGGSGEVRLEIFPYSFKDSDYYAGAIALSLWSYEEGLVYEFTNGRFHNYQKDIPLSDTIFNSLRIERIDAITVKLSYNVKTNSNSNYHHYALILDGVMVNILQEPASNVRVYYGKYPTPLYLDRKYQYWDSGTSSMVYPNDCKFLMHTLGSTLISSSTEISCHVNDWVIVIPEEVFTNYYVDRQSSGGSTYRILLSDATQSIQWGNNTYYYFGIPQLSTSQKIIFTKKNVSE